MSWYFVMTILGKKKAREEKGRMRKRRKRKRRKASGQILLISGGALVLRKVPEVKVGVYKCQSWLLG